MNPYVHSTVTMNNNNNNQLLLLLLPDSVNPHPQPVQFLYEPPLW